MSRFNPLDHPVSLSTPLRLTTTAWAAHVPFAMTLVDLLRPRTIVELGTFYGVSYCAFCQAVTELGLSTRCYAVDTWQGDEQTGLYGAEVYEDLKSHHDPLYSDFSTLMRASFDEALPGFRDGEIDLLHVDGYHTYEVVKRDFENWLPKLSERGVVLLHDIRVRERGFGVWKLWDELKASYPHFEFEHEYGLGVLAPGGNVPEGLRPLLESSAEEASRVRELFERLGERLRMRLDKELEVADLSRQVRAQEAELAARQQTINAVAAEMTAKATQLNNILNSRAWRWVSRYGRAKSRYLTPLYRLLRPAAAAAAHTRLAPAGRYERWIKENDSLTNADREAIRRRIESLSSRPLISVIMPVYDVEEKWLREAIQSVRAQLYPNWELCIADDFSQKSHVRRVLEECASEDSRIKVTFRQQNGHIAAASNSALELAAGEFVAFLDHDDELSEHALYLVAEELNAHPSASLIYSDEDKINETGRRYGPHFKPDWSPDLFYSYNLITHLAVYRRSIVERLGGLREGFDGSQDYDLALRFIEQISETEIRHIPHILYHWRAIPGSVALGPGEKEYAHESARKAIRSHFERRGIGAQVTAGSVNAHRVIYPIPQPAPLVSVIMGTRDRADLLRQAVRGVLEETSYKPIELIIIDNQSAEETTRVFLDEIKREARVKVVRYDAPFNFAAINNLGVRESRGEIICLLNNDIKVMSADWLSELVGHAARPEVGAVGAKLYYADDRIQHAGVVLGVGGIAGHSHRHFPRESTGYAARAQVIQNYAAVTGACMALRREVFDEVGGLDETNLAIAYNDIDLCLRIREKGYRIVWTPYAELYHFESASRGPDDVPEKLPRFLKEREYMQSRWGRLLKRDPFYNPNLTLDLEDFSMAHVPRAEKPWKKQAGQ